MLRAVSDKMQDKGSDSRTSQGSDMIEEVKEIFLHLKAAHKEKRKGTMLRFITVFKRAEKIRIHTVRNDLHREGVRPFRHLLQAGRIGHNGNASPEDQSAKRRQQPVQGVQTCLIARHIASPQRDDIGYIPPL